MKIKFTSVLGLITLVILSSCSNSQELQNYSDDMQTFSLNDTIAVKLGEMQLCEDNLDLFVSFDSLISDSRCPIGAECFWEGNAEGKFAITYKKELEYLNLNTNDPSTAIIELFGYQFQLITINPYPGSTNAETTPKSAQIIVSKMN